MKCPNCGAKTPEQRVPEQPTRTKADWRLKAAVVILSIALAISIAAFAYENMPRPHFKTRLVLEWNTDVAGTGPYVFVSGRLANVGDRAGYGTLHVTVRDSRGWSNETDVNVVALLPLGYQDIALTFDWPFWYNGKSLDGISAPTMKVSADAHRAYVGIEY